jgi:DNA-binding SARP family transcriptional activator
MAEFDGLRVELLDRFRLTRDGEEIVVPPLSATVIAYLAIANRPLHRSIVAGTLWPQLTEGRALACLRSALYRIGAPIIESSSVLLSLRPEVKVDVRAALDLAMDLLQPSHLPPPVGPVVDLLGRELMPNGDDLWLEAERERHRHLRLRALDALASSLTEAHRYTEAVEAALAAIRIEPMSETAEAALVRALVAEGNGALAVQQYNAFRRRLWTELRVRPIHTFAQLAEVAQASAR